VLGVALLIALWFGWRLYRQRQLMEYGRRGPRREAMARVPGEDSELYQVERELAKNGLGRAPGETALSWAERVGPKLSPSLREIVQLHYRYRFDPAGLPASDREQLRQRALALLQAAGPAA
ncbi:MAG: DUF4129 domain-containing protein, partial [Burkholderiales bacterium]